MAFKRGTEGDHPFLTECKERRDTNEVQKLRKEVMYPRVTPCTGTRVLECYLEVVLLMAQYSKLICSSSSCPLLSTEQGHHPDGAWAP